MEHVRLCQVVDILNAAHKVAACGDAACSPPQPWQLVTILRCRRMSGTARLASELPAYFPQAAFCNVRVIRYVAGGGLLWCAGIAAITNIIIQLRMV